ncbi:hypothetical protein [Thiobacillus sedimenti]|uniref:Uncharacterized protein n=1 Tax=Thiobacillus sedimenti TaxID=3110231 RepID=A0ABZ1CIQ9_9PROT|nr:hypothetical protein [Thiobacillus sp. SCUT-2]WRS39286.1 hypothetical protein VA613_00025 [Thiobacillus sp. SCUT-2]
MDSIANYLKDPGWWFSAFFVAIIASVIAGFLKDRIERHLPNLSTRFSAWRSVRAMERAALIKALSDNPSLLTTAYIRAVMGVVLYVLTLLLFLMASLFDELRPHTSAVLGADEKFIVSNILIPFVGGLAVIQGYRASARISVVDKAWGEFKMKHDIPSMP